MFILCFDRLGRYAEINPALQTWMLAGSARYATWFQSREVAALAIPEIVAELGDVWHFTADDLRIIEREALS